jgi:hypothetical protein
MSDFNLRHLINEVSATADDLDYDALSASVLAAISADDRVDALRQALPTFVRKTLNSNRTHGPVTPPRVEEPLPVENPVRLESVSPRSWKHQAVRQAPTEFRDGWQRRLGEIYSTANGNKRLGDFTYDDLLYQETLNGRQAKQKLAKAKGWRKLADLVAPGTGVEKVRDLPAEVLLHTLGAVA